MRRLALVVSVLAACVATWPALVAAPASAHAALLRTEPGNGAVLDSAPQEIRLTFTEPPDPSLSTIGVIDRSGAPVPTGPVEQVPGEGHGIRVRLDDLPDGVYTVTWRTVSTVDGHPTMGAISFGVGVEPGEVVAPEPGGQETPRPTGLAVAGRWALYVGLAVIFGAAIAGLLAFTPATVARPWLLAGAWALVTAAVLVMTLEESAAVDASVGSLLDSETGEPFVRLAVATAVTGVAVLGALFRPGTASFVLLAATAGAAISIRAASGHAGPSAVQAILQGTHFAAAGAWIGGLAWLAVSIRRGLEADRVRRYSSIAAWALAVLLVTGLVRASNELGGPTWWLRAFDNGYGTALVLKLSIVAPLVGLGALNRFRNVRRIERLGSRPLLRTVGGELILAAGVLAMTGVLTGLPPQGSDARTPRAPEPLVVTGSDFATTTNVRLEVTPGTAGPNGFVAEITDYDTGAPVDARRVTLSFELPERPEATSELPLERDGDGTWRATGTSLSLDGTWAIDVLIEAGGGSVEVPLELSTRTTEPRVEISRVPGLPDVYTIHLADGLSIQSFVDPGTPGRTNQVHVTAFDADGSELPLDSAVVTLRPPGGLPFDADLIRGGAAHFIANVELESGTWTFDITARTEDGRGLAASFEQTFEGGDRR